MSWVIVPKDYKNYVNPLTYALGSRVDHNGFLVADDETTVRSIFTTREEARDALKNSGIKEFSVRALSDFVLTAKFEVEKPNPIVKAIDGASKLLDTWKNERDNWTPDWSDRSLDRLGGSD